MFLCHKSYITVSVLYQIAPAANSVASEQLARVERRDDPLTDQRTGMCFVMTDRIPAVGPQPGSAPNEAVILYSSNDGVCRSGIVLAI